MTTAPPPPPSFHCPQRPLTFLGQAFPNQEWMRAQSVRQRYGSVPHSLRPPRRDDKNGSSSPVGACSSPRSDQGAAFSRRDLGWAKIITTGAKGRHWPEYRGQVPAVRGCSPGGGDRGGAPSARAPGHSFWNHSHEIPLPPLVRHRSVPPTMSLPCIETVAALWRR
jgi:hypothetical protein